MADTRRFIARAGPDVTAVRAIPAGSGDAAPPPRPLALAGAHNVILETLKRGDLDSDAAGRRTVVLRLYEAYGGHARADLRVAGTLPVVAAYDNVRAVEGGRVVGIVDRVSVLQAMGGGAGEDEGGGR